MIDFRRFVHAGTIMMTRLTGWRWGAMAGLAAVAVAVVLAPVRVSTAQQAGADSKRWWSPGEGRVLPASAAYDNPYGVRG